MSQILKESLYQLIDRHLPKYSEHISNLVKPALRIRTRPTLDNNISTGSSKIGGFPDLPNSVNWPIQDGHPLDFLGQINLSDLMVYGVENHLPNSGILYFFYAKGNMYNLPNDKACKVIYIPEVNSLERQIPPDQKNKKPNLKSWISFGSKPDPIPACDILFARDLSLPASESLALDPLDFSTTELAEYKQNILSSFSEIKGDSPNCAEHHFFGYPTELETSYYELACLSEERINAISEHPVNKLPEDDAEEAKNWQLLLQVDSDPNAMLNWGMGGRLYFWIRNSDLEQGNFDRVKVIMREQAVNPKEQALNQ